MERSCQAPRFCLASAGVFAALILIGTGRAPAARAQSDAQPRLQFELVSVKANHSDRLGSDGFRVSHGSLSVKNVSLKMLVEAAYGVQGSRVVGGPGWVSSDRYDIVAKGAGGASTQQVWLMLRSLLADRFKVSLRSEVREFPIYSLGVGKSGPKLSRQPTQIAKTPQPPSCRIAPLLFHAEPFSRHGGLREVCWEARKYPFPESPMVSRAFWNVPWSIRPG
jgi:hypothetical protein